MLKPLFRCHLSFILLLMAALAFPTQAQEIGPAKGSLVIVGGALKDEAIIKRFLDLAGGADVPIVVIPTAGGREVDGPPGLAPLTCGSPR